MKRTQSARIKHEKKEEDLYTKEAEIEFDKLIEETSSEEEE